MRNSDLLTVLFSSIVGLSVAVALLACPLCANAEYITIDDFENPDPGTAYFIWFTDSSPYLHKDTGIAGVIGGERDYYVEVMGKASPLSSAGIISDEAGCLAVATFGDPGSLLILQYDGIDPDAPGELIDGENLGGVDLTDGGLNNQIILDFKSLDPGDGTTLKMKVTVNGASGTASKEYDVAQGGGIVAVPFSDLGGNAMFSSVDSLSFAFNDLGTPVQNIDFELDSIQAVPEPSILAMLCGLGAFGLLAWRWRKRRQA